MNLKHKFRFILLAASVVWLLILLGYVSRRPEILQSYSPRKGMPDEERSSNFPTDWEVVRKLGEVKPSAGLTVRIQPEKDDTDMSEVQFGRGKTTRVFIPEPAVVVVSESLGAATQGLYDQQQQPKSTSPYDGPENAQQEQIVGAFKHAWSAYKKYAWGYDELLPLSRAGSNWMDVGLTIVDSLDTMYIMGMKEEFAEAKNWVDRNLKANQNFPVQIFEIVIRLLGGLLSAYHLSGEQVFLDKAVLFGESFKNCFAGPRKLPCHKINIAQSSPLFGETNLAEVGTLQLEFRDLSRSSGNALYERSSWEVSEYLHSLPKFEGLAPTMFDRIDGSFMSQSTVTLGGMGDSYYEYLLKQWLQTGKTINWLKEDFQEAVKGIRKHLLRYSPASRFAYVGVLSSASLGAGLESRMEHLACFLPGALALGYINGLPADMLTLADELTRTCYNMYKHTPLGLSPESVTFFESGHQDFAIEYSSKQNIHRPETVESLYYMYKATKDVKYRDWAWDIFRAFENYTKLNEGYAGVHDVYASNRSSISYINKMETFYLAETLKYLYLIFSDRSDLLPLDRWVFNTEAHPLPIYDH